MSLIRSVLHQTCCGEPTVTVFDFWRAGSGFTTSITSVAKVADKMEDDVLPLLNALQHNGVNNLGLYTYAVRNLVAESRTLSGSGAILPGSNNYNLKSLAYRLRLNVDESLDPATGIPSVFTDERIRRGQRYIPGVIDNYVDNGRYQPGGTFVADVAALITELLTPVVDGGGVSDWIFVVWGLQIMSGGIEVRPEVVAPVVSGYVVGISNLKSRQSMF